MLAYARSSLQWLTRSKLPGSLHRLVNKAVLRMSPAIQAACETRLSEAQMSLAADRETETLLDELPSETTPRERRFLFNFFAAVWSGGNVLEVGPFLGGTSRSIALGMLANPRRDAASRLHTFDRFSHYYGGAQLVETLGPFLQSGKLTEGTCERIKATTSFREVFDLLHAGQPYSSILKTHTGELPERASEVDQSEIQFDPSHLSSLDSVFVDGCKSWFGTKYFMQQVIEKTQPGAFYIFQDYGHYTCFWVPAFVAAFRDRFRFYGHVDSTYAFQLTSPIRAAEIETRFPDEPDGFAADELDRLFATIVADATAASDWLGRVAGRLQHGAALAYVGREDDALRLMEDELRCVVRRAPHFEKMVRRAMHSPTYRPNGGSGVPIVLTK
ncbi:MAG: hypothetical protein QF805_13065 [Pirellulaceae bacterium]|nr:hypothetical protein [Pirellulaceae bacterium]